MSKKREKKSDLRQKLKITVRAHVWFLLGQSCSLVFAFELFEIFGRFEISGIFEIFDIFDFFNFDAI